MTPEINHVLTCSITGLSAAAAVTFKEAGGTVITNPLATDYVIDNGFSSFSGGSQTATLELKPAKLRLLTSPATYICEVKSGTYSDSSAHENNAIVTMLDLGKYFTQYCVIIMVILHSLIYPF